jgi:hypothetical protein
VLKVGLTAPVLMNRGPFYCQCVSSRKVMEVEAFFFMASKEFAARAVIQVDQVIYQRKLLAVFAVELILFTTVEY